MCNNIRYFMLSSCLDWVALAIFFNVVDIGNNSICFVVCPTEIHFALFVACKIPNTCCDFYSL